MTEGSPRQSATIGSHASCSSHSKRAGNSRKIKYELRYRYLSFSILSHFPCPSIWLPHKPFSPVFFGLLCCVLTSPHFPVLDARFFFLNNQISLDYRSLFASHGEFFYEIKRIKTKQKGRKACVNMAAFSKLYKETHLDNDI